MIIIINLRALHDFSSPVHIMCTAAKHHHLPLVSFLFFARCLIAVNKVNIGQNRSSAYILQVHSFLWIYCWKRCTWLCTVAAWKANIYLTANISFAVKVKRREYRSGRLNLYRFLLVVTLILLSSMIIIVVIKLANICILPEYPHMTVFQCRYGSILSLISASFAVNWLLCLTTLFHFIVFCPSLPWGAQITELRWGK